MQKLTKQQADWLLKKVKPRLCDSAQAIGSGVITYRDLINFIENQCTEQEFPGFEVNNIGVKYTERPEEDGYPSDCNFMVTNYVSFTFLNKQEFLEYAKGCQKIVEWIEENEDATNS